MIIGIYTVFDSKSGAYMQPFFSANDQTARRAIHDVVQDPDHTFNKHSEDYTLFDIGSFDDATAEIIPAAPITLGNLLEFKDLPNGQISNETSILTSPASGRKSKQVRSKPRIQNDV